MKIPSKEIMEIFPRLVHLCGCMVGGIIPFVMLPWFWKLGQCLVHIFFSGAGFGFDTISKGRDGEPLNGWDIMTTLRPQG